MATIPRFHLIWNDVETFADVPVNGTLRITPEVTTVIRANDDDLTTLSPQPITAYLTDGILYDAQGNEYVDLACDSALFELTGILRYKVEFLRMKADGKYAPGFDAFAFEAPAGTGDFNLAVAVPLAIGEAPGQGTGVSAGTVATLIAETVALLGMPADTGIRTGIFSFEVPHTHGTSWANQGFNNRRQFMLSQDVIDFRVHWRNRDQLANADSAGTVTNAQFYVDKPEIAGDGNWYGWGQGATPHQVQAPVSVASGTWMVSPWIPRADFAIDKLTSYMLNQGIKAAASGALSFCGAPSWQGYAEGDAGLKGPTMEYVANVTWGHCWIEYRYRNAHALNVMLISNSISNGSNAAAVLNRGEMSAWWQQWALANDAVVANLGCAGAWAGHFNTDGPRWQLYDGCATPYVPDVVIYPALNSSDLVGGSEAVAQANILAVIALAKAKWPNAKHYVTNIPARSEISDDTTRLELNQWMLGLTWQGTVSGVIDMDTWSTDWAAPARFRASLTADGIHFSPQGHLAMAQQMPNLR